MHDSMDGGGRTASGTAVEEQLPRWPTSTGMYEVDCVGNKQSRAACPNQISRATPMDGQVSREARDG